MTYYDYSLIRYMPDARRGEFVNIGLVVYREKHVDVNLLPNLAKARQLDASLSLADIDDLSNALNSIVSNASTVNEMHALIADMGAIKLSTPAYFTAQSNDEYNARINNIMRELVNPRSRRLQDRPHGRLITALKRKYQSLNLLADPGIDVSNNHLVSVGHPVDDNSDLVVDFAQKNGRWHVTQTIDYNVKKLPGKFKEVGIKSVGLDQAVKHLGKDTVRYCIIDAPDDVQAAIQGQINVLSNYADHVLYYGSQEDMLFFWETAISIGHSAP